MSQVSITRGYTTVFIFFLFQYCLALSSHHVTVMIRTSSVSIRASLVAQKHTGVEGLGGSRGVTGGERDRERGGEERERKRERVGGVVKKKGVVLDFYSTAPRS